MPEQKQTEKRFFVLDGNSLIYRAYHAIKFLATRQGEPTNAVYGFTAMLFKLLEEEQPDYICVAFDIGRETFRHEVYADYKGHRAPTPEDLRPQFPLVKKVLKAMRIPVFALEKYEADDLIGTLVDLAEEKGLHTTIISGDRDVLQLVSPLTHAKLTRRGISQMEKYDLARIAEKYAGLAPQQLIDMKALEGDASDNIPGVPSVGPKTAIKLICEYKNIERLLEQLDVIRGKLGERLKENAAQIPQSKWLATIVRDAPIHVDWEQCAYRGPDDQALRRLFQDLEFRTLAKRIPSLMPGATHAAQVERQALPNLPAQAEPKPQKTDYKRISNCQELEGFCQEIETWKKAAKNADTRAGLALYVGPTEPVLPEAQFTSRLSLNFSWAKGVARQVLLPPDSEQTEDEKCFYRQIKAWLADVHLPKIVHDVKALYRLLWKAGYALEGVVGDTLLAAYLTNPTLAKLSLDELVLQALKPSMPGQAPAQDPVWQGAKRAEAIHLLHASFMTELEKADLIPLYLDVELPLTRVLAQMEENGIHLDAAALEKMSEELGAQIETLKQKIHGLAGEEFNVNSPQQLGIVLFEKLKLPVVKKTKTGYSTDAEVLDQLSDQHEMIPHVIEHRQLVKLKSTYVDGMRHLVDPQTGKVHTTFNQAITATGRLSSAEPNLQNIPIRLEYGRKIRKFFAPSKPGWLILAADYSQIELRALAHFSEDLALIRAFKDGRDIHTVTAAQVFAVPEEKVSREMRYRAKAVNFGIVYGLSDFGLARDLGISRTEAKQYITQYFVTYAGVHAFMGRIVQEAQENGYVTTLLGRRRYLPELFSRNRNVREFGERAAINTPIQGTAADIIKLAMLRVDRELRQQQMEARMLLQVHDELIFEIPAHEKAKMVEIVRDAMQGAVTLQVPLRVAIEAGPNWYDLAPCE